MKDEGVRGYKQGGGESCDFEHKIKWFTEMEEKVKKWLLIRERLGKGPFKGKVSFVLESC